MTERTMTGEELKTLRTTRKLSQDGLAKLLNEQTKRSYDRAKVSKWENGVDRIPDDVAALLRESSATVPTGIPTASTGPATILVVINQKGGVQKTGSVVNLAYLLSHKAKKKVLVVDCDAQGSATIHLGMYPPDLEIEGKTLFHVLFRKKPILESIVTTCDGLIDLVPSGISLAKADTEIGAMTNGELRLNTVLGAVRDRYDVILLDCPPHLGKITISALNAANQVLIPSNPEMLSIMGIPAILESVEEVQQTVNPDLSILGILPTRYDQRRSQDKARMQDLAGVAADNGLHMFPPIKNAVIYVEGVNAGQPALKLDPNAPGAEAFEEVMEALLEAAKQGKETANVA
ncbi:AAA family ATPase [Azospirillum brasilense]|uniref:Chromosome partitioning protein ParA n=1 Tax=Azospirillum brasilense TaxID=192 RepID=A0A6L3ASB4_AZOBR|nr:AAA family ATPase [Azospirillum brasilense]KAA0678198.1 chromosome partitioning protein [Azospirillum brasilense]